MDGFMARVSAAQLELKAPKGQYNSFGKYNYRSCEDILEAAKPICAKHGLVLTIGDRLENIGERYYVHACATLLDTESDSTISNDAYARESAEKKGMDDSQITGTASSYARKYALNGLFCIDDTKDADTPEFSARTRGVEEKPPEKGKASSDTVCEECGKPIKDAKNSAGEVWKSKDIAVYTKLKFNRQLCVKCMHEVQKNDPV